MSQSYPASAATPVGRFNGKAVIPPGQLTGKDVILPKSSNEHAQLHQCKGCLWGCSGTLDSHQRYEIASI